MIKPIFNINTEMWSPITNTKDIKPYYSISSFGNIFSHYSNSFMTQFITENGYNVVGLMTLDGRKILRKVHRIELMQFMYFPECEEYEVNHKDGNKQNNYLHNLEWSTSKENINHAIINGLRQPFSGENNPCAKFTENEILHIGELIMCKKYSDDKIMELTGCNYETLIGIISGNVWNYLFTNEQRSLMRLGRRGYNVSIKDKENICKYYEDNKPEILKYGDATKLVKGALIYLNIEVTATNLRIAKRLFYRHQDADITAKYNY